MLIFYNGKNIVFTKLEMQEDVSFHFEYRQKLNSFITLDYSLVSFAACDADKFFDPTSIAQSFCVLHILGDYFM